MMGMRRRTTPWATVARTLAIAASLAIVITGAVLIRARPVVTVEPPMSPEAAGASMRNALAAADTYLIEQRTTTSGTQDAAQEAVRLATARYNGNADDDDVFEAFTLDYLAPDGRPITDRAMRLLWLNDDTYLVKMPGQPGRRGQQWFQYPDDDEDQYSASGSPWDIWDATGSVDSWFALDDFIGHEFGPAHPEDGWSLTGSVPARSGVTAFGSGRARARDYDAIERLTGRSIVHVEIGADHRPLSLEIRGSEVDLGDTERFSADWVDGVRHSVVRTTFGHFNDPITEQAPPPDQITSITQLSQAEMIKMLRPYSNLFFRVSA